MVISLLRNRWRLLAALVIGGAATVAVLITVASTNPADTTTPDSSQVATTLPAGAVVSEDGVMVYQDADGKIIVANRDQLPFRVSFPLPRNCAENKKLISDLIADAETATLANADQRSQMLVLDRLAQDLCSWREYNTFAGQINSFWQDNIYLPSTTPGRKAGSGDPGRTTMPTATAAGIATTSTTAPATTLPTDNG